MHDWPIDPSLLPALHALLEERHVSRAARRIGVTQPAMSRILARLRSALGDPLLVRAGRAWVLSARAERLQRPLQASLEQLTRMLAGELDFEPGSSQRVFRLASADYGVTLAVLPLLRQLQRSAPRLQLLVEPLRSDFDEQLERGSLDFVLAPRRAARTSLVWSKLRTDRFVTLARRAHPQVQGSLTLATYCALSHVVVVPEWRLGNPIDAWLAERGKSRHIALRVPSFLAGPLAVVESDLILTTPASLARRFASGFPLQVLPTPVAVEPITLALAWHERQRRDAGHTFLRTQLQRAVRDP
jgi:DNA-binding transcriptional LysR family regulator